MDFYSLLGFKTQPAATSPKLPIPHLIARNQAAAAAAAGRPSTRAARREGERLRRGRGPVLLQQTPATRISRAKRVLALEGAEPLEAGGACPSAQPAAIDEGGGQANRRRHRRRTKRPRGGWVCWGRGLFPKILIRMG